MRRRRTSPCGASEPAAPIRPHWALHELRLPYTTKPIGPRTGETKTPEYTKLNPRQKVPLLQDGDFSHRRERGDRRLSVANVLDAGRAR